MFTAVQLAIHPPPLIPKPNTGVVVTRKPSGTSNTGEPRAEAPLTMLELLGAWAVYVLGGYIMYLVGRFFMK